MYFTILRNSLITALLTGLLAIYLYRPLTKTVEQQKITRSHLLNPVEQLPPSDSPLHIFNHAAICSDNNICSNMARRTLERAGSAVDAALSALLCNGLIGMQSMGLGGGFFMNFYNHSERRSYSILSREIAPISLSDTNYSIFQNEDELRKSSWSIAVPTELMGYALAHERFGRLPWHELVMPTLELCRQGYHLYKHQFDALMLNKEMIKSDILLSKMFVNPSTGEFWNIGTLIQLPKQLCKTYEQLAQQGPRSFYKKYLADKLYADLFDMKSSITKDDLAAAHAKLSESLVLALDEHDLHLVPLPGSGYVLGFIMNLLKNFRKDFEQNSHFGALEIHRIVEAMKFGFVKRWQLDELVDDQLLENMTDATYAATLAKLIDDTQTFNNLEFYEGNSEIRSRKEHGTAHTSVLHNNDAVSVTSSINFYFGSGRMGKRTGILFNNAMSDFSLKQIKNYFELPFVPNKNTIAAGARPMSSMCPVIVTERSTGRVRLVVGAAGGTQILSALVPLLIRTLWQHKDIKSAIDANRFHHQMLPNILQYEYGLLQKHIYSLIAKGHNCLRYRNRGSVICGIERKNETIFGNSDYRKYGGVAGF